MADRCQARHAAWRPYAGFAQPAQAAALVKTPLTSLTRHSLSLALTRPLCSRPSAAELRRSLTPLLKLHRSIHPGRSSTVTPSTIPSHQFHQPSQGKVALLFAVAAAMTGTEPSFELTVANVNRRLLAFSYPCSSLLPSRRCFSC